MSVDKDVYQRSVRKQLHEGKTEVSCYICGENDPDVIEVHHIFGNEFPEERIPLCQNCHQKVTKYQNKIPPKKRNGILFQLLPASIVLKLLMEQLMNCALDGCLV
jgi:5-methylcytosine-specific restriction endonuclease McrA